MWISIKSMSGQVIFPLIRKTSIGLSICPYAPVVHPRGFISNFIGNLVSTDEHISVIHLGVFIFTPEAVDSVEAFEQSPILVGRIAHPG